MPCPSEIVPGVSRIISPITGMIGACTASMRERRVTACIILGASGGLMIRALAAALLLAVGSLQTPEQFFGHRIGADNKLARWDKIVDYMKLVAASSDRVRFRELGKTSNGNPFIAL